MKDNSGSAFPVAERFYHDERTGNTVFVSNTGLTIRDYFAAKAMAAIIGKIPFEEFPEDFSPYEKTAIGAYDYADAMIKARVQP